MRRPAWSSKLFHTAYGTTLSGLPYAVWKCRGDKNGPHGGRRHDLAEQCRGKPSDDTLSAFVNEQDPALRLAQEKPTETAALPLTARHETTVNQVTKEVPTPPYGHICAFNQFWGT
ncbi:hypothetical protein SO3561_09547 [Streptomyces olivochromogenes]|uniref:Uncharacterized protein n=1 Tax=Streptomyces olivochromogenes TaxID=1963 RepID=A0A250VV58_STROL|nr:hypothetical protein SO3561_09547 [Streptomyces olivochromogenes]